MAAVLEEVVRYRVETLRHVAEVPAQQEPPVSGNDADHLINLSLSYPQSLRQLVDRVWADMTATDPVNLDTVNDLRRMLQGTFQDVLSLMEMIRREVASQDRVRADTIAAAFREVETVRDNTLSLWEEFRPEDLVNSDAEHQRGESLDIDEAFAQMKGISVEELHRRLEEHREKRKALGWSD